MNPSRTIRVIGVMGSPRLKGNTATLLARFLAGAADAGAITEEIVLIKQNYSPCSGCNACHKTGSCILDDDAPALLEGLMNADCIVIASPVYSMGITAELKSFIDRAHYLWVRQFRMKMIVLPPERKQNHYAYYISTAGMDRPDVFDTAFPTMRALFNILGFAYCQNILAPDLDRYEGIANHPYLLEKAYNAGSRAVMHLREGRPCLPDQDSPATHPG